jgi:hypothetical protein
MIFDSWFGGVETCRELKLNGLYSIMVVKTNDTGFPKIRLQ